MTDNDRPLRMCSHLTATPHDYYVWFTGRGMDRYWVCSECAERYPELPIDFDRYLFSVHDEHGIAVWDIKSGERLLQDPTFAPIHYHPCSKDFISRTDDGICLSRLIDADSEKAC